eukprot:CAMPEP_0170473582 /NCGR_PEP_ID=MMETSP0123-20130129/15478_1 /TAXON_ID=182087 /ORGANISM="Favella ehrenbergii, Strain Fehren 1" /LENGTH=99 /DNA_ID=CAMNT_0010742727 /DNA_START=182 /DNA_END=476 /DNA_ORIENTATION=+
MAAQSAPSSDWLCAASSAADLALDESVAAYTLFSAACSLLSFFFVDLLVDSIIPPTPGALNYTVEACAADAEAYDYEGDDPDPRTEACGEGALRPTVLS